VGGASGGGARGGGGGGSGGGRWGNHRHHVAATITRLATHHLPLHHPPVPRVMRHQEHASQVQARTSSGYASSAGMPRYPQCHAHHRPRRRNWNKSPLTNTSYRIKGYHQQQASSRHSAASRHVRAPPTVVFVMSAYASLVQQSGWSAIYNELSNPPSAIRPPNPTITIIHQHPATTTPTAIRSVVVAGGGV